MSNALLAYWGRLPGNLRGIVLMLLSTVGFASMHTLIRIVSAEIHPIQIAFFRNFFGLIVFLPWFLKFGFAPLRTRRLPLHGLRAVLNVCAMFAFFTALSMTPLAQVTALDISKARMTRVAENLTRTGLQAELVLADMSTWQPDQPFDAVLLDAPCSATGTLRRHPDLGYARDGSGIGP